MNGLTIIICKIFVRFGLSINQRRNAYTAVRQISFSSLKTNVSCVRIPSEWSYTKKSCIFYGKLHLSMMRNRFVSGRILQKVKKQKQKQTNIITHNIILEIQNELSTYLISDRVLKPKNKFKNYLKLTKRSTRTFAYIHWHTHFARRIFVKSLSFPIFLAGSQITKMITFALFFRFRIRF